MTSANPARRVVRVSTDSITGKDWPEQDAFLKWLDTARDGAEIKNDFELATRASISHSTLSAYRRKPKPKQIPNTGTLSALARVLRRPTAEAWRVAGYLNEADELSHADDEGLRIIRESGLAPEVVDVLIAAEIEDRVERARRAVDLARKTTRTSDSDSRHTGHG
jgi:hypothetical protein